MTETDPIKSILYVEDEQQYGEIITQLHNCVQRKFYGDCEFKVVPTWGQAEDAVIEDAPSVVLLDLTLLPMSSEDTLAALNKVARKWPPVMVLTGNKFDLELRRKCILAGADDFMLKDDANRNPELLCERLYSCFLRRIRDDLWSDQ